MRDRCRRDPTTLGVVLDVGVNPIHRSGQSCAQEHRNQHPVLDGHIGRQREKIKSDVLPILRIACGKRHLIKEAQENCPVVQFSPGDKRSENYRVAGNDGGRPEPIAHEIQDVR